MDYVCYRKIIVFWLWMFAVAFVIGAWLVIMSSCNLADSEDETEITTQEIEDALGELEGGSL